jgi:glycosyltransferase involved in cell wall biosynthesis
MKKSPKVAFYMPSSNLNSKDFRQISRGNPGVGGTEFAMVLSALALANKGCEVQIYSRSTLKLPEDIRTQKVLDFQAAISRSAEKGEILIYRPTQGERDFVLSTEVLLVNARLIPWLQLDLKPQDLKKFADIKEVVAIACLGLSQRIKLRDNPIWKKSFVVPNPVVINGKSKSTESESNSPQVVYLGALVPQKSFHVLADRWNRIKNKVPGATLHVIGSGNLYDTSAEMGMLGLATPEYERRIFRHLNPSDDSVKFWGRVDSPSTRENIIMNSKVGIVNPLGTTETFCISGVEIQALGIPVVTRRHGGLRDTIVNKETGRLYRGKGRSLEKYIVKLLKNPEQADRMGKSARVWANNQFNVEKVGDIWYSLICNIEESRSIDSFQSQSLWMRPGYVCRALNSIIVKGSCGILPTISEIETTLRKLIRKILFLRRMRDLNPR